MEERVPPVPEVPEPVGGFGPVEVRFRSEGVERALEQAEEIRRLFRERMREGVHYWRVRPDAKPSLTDAGASLLMDGFGVFPLHRLLDRREDPDGHVRYVVQAVLLDRRTGRPVSGGIGSCSSREARYAFRWVPAEEVPPEERVGLRRRVERGREYYRVPNPEVGDLDNTLLKLAAKRAEVDAVLHLPGVGALFTQDLRPRARLGREEFWARVRGLGYGPREALEALGVRDLREWEASGRGLEEALRLLEEGRRA